MKKSESTPPARIRSVNDHNILQDGNYVLYWMTAFRRLHSNFALQHAVERANQLRKPLVILEALRSAYPYASPRIHRFILDGMADNLRRAASSPAMYLTYVERQVDEGKGLLKALAEQACVVVTDDYPCFMIPRMMRAAASRIAPRMEAVDAHGIVPLSTTPKAFARAVDFRRYIQKNALEFLEAFPESDPLSCLAQSSDGLHLPDALSDWDFCDVETLSDPGLTETLTMLDSTVPVTSLFGGESQAKAVLDTFLSRLDDYAGERNHPDSNAASGLSPYFHFGHISAHEVFEKLGEREGFATDGLGSTTRGSREGFWNLSPSAEAFIDQFVTWRELGANMCWHHPKTYKDYESLPGWARKTLAEHASDPRPYVYSYEELENARTHDEIWNAAQRELRQNGTIQNYLRMLWGKKILQWTENPQQALQYMIELNDRWALDGRDPNSYSGIFWVLGRYDRAWGPERDIFGKIRYMTSESARRKLRLNEYLSQWSPDQSRGQHE